MVRKKKSEEKIDKQKSLLIKDSTASNKKAYVLDTNVLVHDPRALFSFDNSHVFLPIVVLEELDHFKKEGTDRGRNTRQVIRYLDELREKGNLGSGVELSNNSTIEVLVLSKDDHAYFDSLGIIHTDDNKIILHAIILKEKGYDVYFISKDLNARVKANVFGIISEDYIKESIPENEIYRGYYVLDAPAIELKKDESLLLEKMEDNLLINEFVLMQSQHNMYNNAIVRFLGKNKGFKHINRSPLSWPISAKNPQQAMALDLLLDPKIQLVCLLGPAGTGKTFLALAAGLYSVIIEKKYEKMLISRPVIPLGKDIGYLPGTIEEKLHSWMLPIYDNMELIMHEINAGKHVEQVFFPQKESNYQKKKNYQRKNYHQQKHYDQKNYEQKNDFYSNIQRSSSVHELIRLGKIGLEAITYMRGRSIPYQFILIDEAQNLSRHEIKTLITRAGEGSKIVLTGDPYQIDSPYLDFSSNGIVVAAERFKGNSIFGSVFLDISERSELSKIASNLL